MARKNASSDVTSAARRDPVRLDPGDEKRPSEWPVETNMRAAAMGPKWTKEPRTQARGAAATVETKFTNPELGRYERREASNDETQIPCEPGRTHHHAR